MRNLVFCGDIHGELATLVWKITEQLKLVDTDVVIVGDFGVGFGKPGSLKQQYERVQKRLVEKNNTIYTIRGNHDDPSYFDGTHNFEHLIFLPDHTVIELGGKTIYPIGGATSTDLDLVDPRTRRSRRQEELFLSKHGKHCWWENETVEQKRLIDLPLKVDIIISHTAPLKFSPPPFRANHIGLEEWEKILKEREYLNQVEDAINYDKWFYGHFHRPYSGNIGGKLNRCLTIMEIAQCI